MIRIEFGNSRDKAVFVQVDPWACLYRLDKGDRIEFIVDGESIEQAFSIEEYDDDNRILTLFDCDEFFIVKDGERVHWEKFQTNM